MYIATVILNRTEKQFWKMTLRKLVSLYEEHKAANGETGSSQKEQTTYIDQVM